MEIAEDIEKWKKKRNAVILAHNYQLPEVQDIADYVGDSLGLSIQAAKTEADVVALNQLANLRPMWADENNRKKNQLRSLL